MFSENDICTIGKQMVYCAFNCKGIVNDTAKGIVPRGMIYSPSSSNWGVVLA